MNPGNALPSTEKSESTFDVESSKSTPLEIPDSIPLDDFVTV
jgi:hypothetical protein